jgi:hypothetical protein
MPSNATSPRSKRTRTSLRQQPKGAGKGKGKHKGTKGKGKGERIVTVNSQDRRQERSSDRRAEVKLKMLSTVLPKIAELSVEGSDTLFEVLSQGAKLSQEDVKKYLAKPTSDRKRLVLQYYKTRWEKDAEFRAVWPADRTDLTNALKEWAHDQFIQRASALTESSPQGSKLSGDRRSTQSTPVPAAAGKDTPPPYVKRGDDGLAPRRHGSRSSALLMERQAEQQRQPRPSPESRAGGTNRTRGSGSMKGGASGRRGSHAMRSCVDLPPPLRSPALSKKNSIVLPPPPSKHARQSAEGGTLSAVISPEVMVQVADSVVRLNGEASRGHV